ECERAINLIQKAIELHEGEVTKEFIEGNLITPSFILSSKNTYKITLYSGTASNRWNIDIYQEIIKDNGGTLREGADAIITIVSKGNNSYQEEARLAFEFSSALPAGNNSWQRSGRALSFSQAKVPYIYSTEVGGYELDNNGNKKATRQASSSLVLSYILNSRRKQILNLIHYRLSPSASEQIKKQFSF
ncbi:TPA: hypothetical protein U1262_002173, partial [Streptococcus suis]|nr:hypothetical protein [Streptococcus suis]